MATRMTRMGRIFTWVGLRGIGCWEKGQPHGYGRTEGVGKEIKKEDPF
jgi:hypothetical protein